MLVRATMPASHFAAAGDGCVDPDLKRKLLEFPEVETVRRQDRARRFGRRPGERQPTTRYTCA